MHDAPQQITELVDRPVYTNNGIEVGHVEDLQLDIDAQAVTGLAVTSLNDDLFDDEVRKARGVIIPYRWIRSVGDIILVSDIIERLRDSEEDEPEVVA
ncbi:MAG: PRC-barrel domain-containing protein [Natrialbaceae archaeon]|nr:PRC-barrel domain-containing protein [Natrialbaceae archaeon]